MTNISRDNRPLIGEHLMKAKSEALLQKLHDIGSNPDTPSYTGSSQP